MAERKSLFSIKNLSTAESIMSDLINIKPKHTEATNNISLEKKNIDKENLKSVNYIDSSIKQVIDQTKLETVSNIKISKRYLKKHINLTFREDIINKIKKYAKERNLSVSELLEQFIEQL